LVQKEDQGFWASLMEAFSSLKLTIALLLILAGASIVGTMIPQNVSVEEYLKFYSHSTYQILKILGLLDMYHAGWFVFLLVLLGLNLAACSGKRFRGTWKFFTHPVERPSEGEWSALPFKKIFSAPGQPADSLPSYRDSLSRVFHSPKILEEPQTRILFAEKGKLSRLGVYFIHLSILVILTGGLLGSLYGYHGEMSLTEGEETDRVILQDQGERQLLGFRVRLDQFSVSFYSSGAPKEFKSTLTLLKGDQEILTQPIRVNHPLKYQGISFYQASYGVADLKKAILAVRDRDSGREEVISARLGEPTAIPGNTGHFMLSRFEPNFQGMGPALRVFFPEPGRAHESFWILQNHPEVEKSRPGRYQLSIKEIQPRYFSGLQVTQDPGVWVVWAGCFLMIAGFYITFLMVHRRVWVRFSLEGAGTKVEVAGDSHRDRIAFAREWERIVQSLENISPSAKNG